MASLARLLLHGLGIQFPAHGSRSSYQESSYMLYFGYHTVGDYIELLSYFNDIRFQYIPRSVNQVAHALAKAIASRFRPQ